MATRTKIALITGGSRGLGKNMALQLAGKGHDIILTYNSNKTEAEKVVDEIRGMGRNAEAYQLDTTNIVSFDGFFAAVSAHLMKYTGSGNFDILINNAGTGAHYSVADTPEAVFDQLYSIHLKGVFFLTQKALPLLNDNGRVINISSGLARFTYPGYAAYASMKGAIEVFTRYLAKELGPRGITVNTIAPGLTETDFTRGGLPPTEEGRKQVASIFALGRIGQPEDIGAAVTLICSEEARWITAQRIEVSGGQQL
ncbi:SDR family NAD(P)-dependent oxidoreductase [Puia dinghuensis]|uniref:3-oxoacyl-ACP reductase n=1 Tax=Puia dinghuensis TaxID=1792502 RepID=A0A8J2UE15_9BACT|nr:SDR family oxidoreductase [Puia dinghuensis]GGB02975.1 3-oxoacyl-ACP reductase [Puia dinghuensis]